MVENRFFMTDDILIEFIIKVLSKKLIIQSMVVSVVSLVFLIYQILQRNTFFVGVYLVNTIICSSAGIVTPIILFKSFKKDNLAKGYKDEIIITFTEDKITLKEGSTHLEVAYENILEIHTLKKSCVFMLSSQNGIIVNLNTFTKGSLEDCINLANKNKALG